MNLYLAYKGDYSNCTKLLGKYVYLHFSILLLYSILYTILSTLLYILYTIIVASFDVLFVGPDHTAVADQSNSSFAIVDNLSNQITICTIIDNKTIANAR